MTAAKHPSWFRIILEPVVCVGSGVAVFLLLHYVWPGWLLLVVILTLLLLGLAQVPRRLPGIVKGLIMWSATSVAIELLVVLGR